MRLPMPVLTVRACRMVVQRARVNRGLQAGGTGREATSRRGGLGNPRGHCRIARA